MVTCWAVKSFWELRGGRAELRRVHDQREETRTRKVPIKKSLKEVESEEWTFWYFALSPPSGGG